MASICLIIPTQNRSECIRNYLEQVALQFFECSIDIIVLDGSVNKDTEQVVCYFAQTYSNIQFCKYTGPENDYAIDQKIYWAAQNFAKKYDYIWFSSDGTIIHVEKMKAAIIRFVQQKNDLLIWDNGAAGWVEYQDPCALFRECIWRMTSLSSVLVSSQLMLKAMELFPVSHALHKGFWLPMVYFYYCDKNHANAVFYMDEGLWSANPTREAAFWQESGRVLWQWGEVWCEAIDALPARYDADKADAILSHDLHMKLFSCKSLLSLKVDGNLTLKKVREQHDYIPRITQMPRFFFYTIAFVPCTYLLRGIRKWYHKISEI